MDYYQPLYHEKHKKLKFLQTFHKKLDYLIIIQRVVMTNDKVKRKINSILLIDKPTTTLKKYEYKIDNLYGSRKMRSFIRIIDQQTIPLKVDLGWTTSQTMQHSHTMFKRMYCLIPSRVVATNTEDHKKVLRARTRDKAFHNYAFRTKKL